MKDYKFEYLYEISSGLSSTKSQAGHGAPFLSFSSVFNNFFLPDKLPDKMDTSVEEQERYSIKEGDIFLTRTSETLDELAMSSVAVKDYPHATYSGFLKRLRPTQSDITYAKFMAFYLRSAYFRKIIDNNATMTLRASFNEDIFSWLHLMLPGYNEQKKIGDWLYALESKIKNNHRVITTLESMAKTLYDYWFVQFDFPDANGRPYKTSGGKMEWNENLSREIPAGWEVKKLGDICETRLGGTPDTNNGDYWGGDIPWLNSGEVAISPILSSEKKITDLGRDNSATSTAEPGDVLMSITRYIRPSILGISACYNQSVVAVLHNERYKTSFIYPFLLSQVERYMGLRIGAQQPHINKKIVDLTMVITPPKSILDKYYIKVDKVYRQIVNVAKENKKLIELRDFILPMLMNGQVTFRKPDANGSVVIMKNNAPKYVPIEYKQVEKEAVASDEEVMAVTERLMQKNMEALKVLAK